MHKFRFTALVLALASAHSYAENTEQNQLDQAQTSSNLSLPVISLSAQNDVLATQIAGNYSQISQQQLEQQHPFSVNEVLRQVAGVNVRDEEGVGLRPNIAIRGLNPTRSTKVTLLEDGIPLAYAPYGDNASYYHPQIDRYSRIEVLKGAETLLYGPQTIAGVINYIGRQPSNTPQGQIQVATGNRDFLNTRATVEGYGAILDYTHKDTNGSRENMSHQIDDVNLKYVFELNDENRLMFRANYYQEDSQVTYTGLTQAEFERQGAQYNPFKNDEFVIQRTGASVSHEWKPAATGLTLNTNLYYSQFDRDWWRQSSNSTDAQCGAAFSSARLAGVVVNVDDCNSTQGRLRNYTTYGIEPRLTWENALGQLEAGVKAHFELQQRQQQNGTAPSARTGTLVEDNERRTDAYSAYLAQRFQLSDTVQLMPIVRHEYIKAERDNLLNNLGAKDSVKNTSAGLGLNWNVSNNATVFASVHQGFAPPRVEDLISNSGGLVDVKSEQSVNSEIGIRAEPIANSFIQAAVFHNDFKRLTAVGSIAGGSTPLSQGQATFTGLELSGQYQHSSGLNTRLAYTWLPVADQDSAFVNVASGAAVGVAGNRQPYAPKNTLTWAVGYSVDQINFEVEAQYVGAQFSDFANTFAASADGQRGVIDSFTVFNSSVNYNLNPDITLFLSGKNLGDKTYIVDRTRGIQVGMPRLLQVGANYRF